MSSMRDSRSIEPADGDAPLQAAHTRPLTPAQGRLAVGRSTMNLGLANLIDEGSDLHVEESRAFYGAKQAEGGQHGPTTYEELKVARRSLPAGPADSRAVERIVRAGNGQVPVRITSPSSGESRATCLDIHGGGFYMDSASRGDARNARLADALGVTVVSVEYRLAPEHPWPAAPDDCETAALWLVGEGRTMFGTRENVDRWRVVPERPWPRRRCFDCGTVTSSTRLWAPCCSLAPTT